MPIALLTADLRAGHSGLGDYCLGLARALRERGQEVKLAALAAPAGPTPALDLECAEEIPWSKRMGLLRAALARWQPAWVFLQSMPQLYHPRAWLRRQIPGLAEALAGQRVAVMLHELESSLTRGGEPAARRRRARQAAASLALIETLKPALVLTSNAVYSRRLARSGVSAEVLPLFSHLPVGPMPAGPWLEAELAKRGCPPRRENRALFGVMGRIAEDWAPEGAFADCVAAADAAGLSPLLLFAGRSGLDGRRLAAWQAALPRLAMADLGPLPAERMVQLLNSLHLLISQTPYELLGKSSIVAAALAQGVPLLASHGRAGAETPLPGWPEALILPPGHRPDAALLRRPGSGPFCSRLGPSAERLLALLGAAAGGG